MSYKSLICLFIYFYKFFYTEVEKDNDNIDCSENNKFVSNFVVYYKDEKYNIADFINLHPGGKKILLEQENKDITQLFDNIKHSKKAIKLLDKMKYSK